jgi:transcriptional regulator with XRE-family HTH domain
MSVGQRIKKLRDDLGMSQVSFAKAIGVSKQTLYKYENDLITNIPSDKIEAAAEIGKVTPGFLMGWEEEGVGNFQQQEYYTNPETAKLADEMAVNPELKALFDVQRDMSPADLQTLYDMALALKRRAERLDSDDPC